MIRTSVCILLVGTGLIFSSMGLASTPILKVTDVYVQDGYVCVDFYLKNAIDGELLTSIRNGVPALLSYRIDVWNDRSNWFDKLISTVTYSFKVSYDNWDTLYCIYDGSEIRTVQSPAQLVHTLCNQKGVKACLAEYLDTTGSYYVTIGAEVRSLGAETIREVESWLGGKDENDNSRGGLLDLVIGLFTSKSKTVQAKSYSFRLQGISR